MPPPLSPALYEQFARGWRAYALVGLIALASSLFGATRMPVMDREEALYAQATRQMLETRDFAHVEVQTAERTQTALGGHWAQAAAVRALAGLAKRNNAIWPYRLASALGLVIAALATLWGGAALIGERAALLGAALFAAGMLAGFEGMSATADALGVGCTTLALAALARMRGEGPHRAHALVFYFALAAAMVVKGPLAPFVAGAALLTLAWWERSVSWMKPLLWWPGPLVTLLVVIPWIVIAGGADAIAPDLAVARPGHLAVARPGHLALPGYHLALLSFLIFPATYALPAAARLVSNVLRGRAQAEEERAVRFLIAWAGPTFLLFELLPTKLLHYPFAAYPAITLLCGAGLAATLQRRSRAAHPTGVVLFAVAGLVIVALMSLGVTFMPGDEFADLRRAVSAGLVGLVIMGAAIAGLIVLRRPVARVAVLAGCALAISYSLRSHILPEARSLHVSTEAVAALTRARLLPTETRTLWVVGYREPSIVFQTRTTTRIATAAEAGRMAAPGDALIVEGRELPAVSVELGLRRLGFREADPPVRGLNLGDSTRVALFIGQIENAPADDAPADAPPRNP